MTNIYVNAEKQVKKVNNFWNHIHFHPTDAIEDNWGREILDSVSADKAARMVRIYAMLEDIVYEDDNGELAYDFFDTDKRIDYMVSKGFKLLICMNFLPRAIAKDKTVIAPAARYKGKHLVTSVPSDYRLWQEVCAKYAEHLVNRYGIDLASSWYFHCWNEPNSSHFWMSDCKEWAPHAEEYLKLYDFFAEGIKSVSEKLRVGGPSAAFRLMPDAPYEPGYDPLIDVAFIKMVLNHAKSGKNFANGGIGTAFDFFTVHAYGFEPEELETTRCIDPKLVTNMLRDYRRLASECGFEGIEMISDEWEATTWGFSGIAKNPVFDYRNNEIFPAHYFSLIDTVINENIDINAIMVCLSGAHNLPADFAGTRTFATKSGFKLPIYNGYALSAMLGETLLDCEKDGKIGVIPTVCDNGDVAIAVFNFAKNLLKPNGTIHARLNVKLPEGKYNVTHYRLDRDNCNSYTAWKEFGKPEHCSQFEAEMVKQASELKPWYPDESFEGSDFTLDITLPDYSISLIKLSK